MIKKIKLMITATIGLIIIFSITGCNSLTKKLDVVATESVKSFETILEEIDVKADSKNNGWLIEAPDKSARFIWSEDFSKSPLYDVMIELEAQPFIDAGLDINNLPADIIHDDGVLIIGQKLGDDVLAYEGSSTAIDAYKHIVDLYRDHIGYHMQMDHYGVDLGGGNMFEWAKDLSENDKDIVFVLNPESFINAGVDPENIDGWTFASVSVMDEDGKEIEKDKILKFFDLR